MFLSKLILISDGTEIQSRKSIYFNYHLNYDDLHVEYFDAVVQQIFSFIHLISLIFLSNQNQICVCVCDTYWRESIKEPLDKPSIKRIVL